MPSQPSLPLDEKHVQFRKWVESQGVIVNGVSPANLPGKGTGMIATKKLQKGDRLIFVPVKSLITLDSGFVGEFVSEERLTVGPTKGLTVHGTVAAALTRLSNDETRAYKPWEMTWPTRDDFLDGTPLCWDKDMQQLLPPTTLAYLEHQQSKFEKDWTGLESHLPGHDKETYKYYWLVVNTRCFYWEYFKLARAAKKKGKRLDRDDCMALCPFADYFNHEDEGCTFSYNANGCSVICNRSYDIGEEVVVSYGQHSNDYLLIEYSLIVAGLKPTQSTLLEENGYLGDYTLDATSICYRTQTAIRSTITSARKMQQFVSGEYDGSNEEGNLDNSISNLLVRFRKQIVDGCRKVEKLGEEEGGRLVDGVFVWKRGGNVDRMQERRRAQLDVIMRRWTQMKYMLDGCEEEMEK